MITGAKLSPGPALLVVDFVDLHPLFRALAHMDWGFWVTEQKWIFGLAGFGGLAGKNKVKKPGKRKVGQPQHLKTNIVYITFLFWVWMHFQPKQIQVWNKNTYF